MQRASGWKTAGFLAALALAPGCSRDRVGSSPEASSNSSPPATHSPAPASDSNPSEPRAPDAGRSTRPEGYVSVTVAGVAPTPHGSAVLLLEQESQRVVPVFVGSTEALAIELRLEHRRYGRPLTHDLLDSVLSEVGGTVDSVRVDKLAAGVFYATVVLRYEGKARELDARSSDAVAIALGHGTPIFMARSVLTEAGVSLDSVQIPDGDGGPNDIEDKAHTVTL